MTPYESHAEVCMTLLSSFFCLNICGVGFLDFGYFKRLFRLGFKFSWRLEKEEKYQQKMVIIQKQKALILTRVPILKWTKGKEERSKH